MKTNNDNIIQFDYIKQRKKELEEHYINKNINLF